MPAPKSGSSPDDSESNMNISDEDGEDLPSKTSPATHKLTLKRGHVRETTAPPRTKKKLSDSVEGGNIFDRSSSSPPKDSMSDPPVKKAKLLNASSASCGEALSQTVNSKVSLKRAASTDSEDEMSSDGSKTDIFRERDDGDKARCVRQYSNRVKAKRRAEELPSAPQERSQDPSSAPTGTIQMDHDYGRATDEVSAQSFDGDNDVKEKNNQFVSQECLVHSTESAAGSLRTGAQFECASDKTQHNPNSTTNAAPASHRDSAAVPDDVCVASVAAANENHNVAESLEHQKESGDERQVSFSETLNSSPAEATAGCREEPHTGERSSWGHAGQICVHSASENKDTTKRSDSQSEESATSPVGPLETQTDHGAREEPKPEPLQHRVTHNMPDTTTGSFDDMHKIACNPDESESKEFGSPSAPPLASPGSAVDMVDKRTDSTSEAVDSAGWQNQTEIDPTREPKIDTNSQPDSAQEQDLQIDESYECISPAADATEEADHEQAATPGTQVKMDANPLGTAELDISNGAVTAETEITTGSNECSAINAAVEHQDDVNLENASGQKSPVREGLNPECKAEAHNQDREEADGPDRDASAGDHHMVTEQPETTSGVTPVGSSPGASEHASDRGDEVQNLPVVFESSRNGGTDEADVQTASEDVSDAAAASETQESARPVSENVLEDHGSDKLVPTECGSPAEVQPELDFQTMAASEDLCSPTDVSKVAAQEELECKEEEDTRMEAAVVQANSPEVISLIHTHTNTGLHIQEEDGDVNAACVQTTLMETTSTSPENLQSSDNLRVSILDTEDGKDVTSECCDGEKDDVKDQQLQMDTETSATAGEASVASSAAEVEIHQSPDIVNHDTENPVKESSEIEYSTVESAEATSNTGTAAEEEETSNQQSTAEAQRSDNLEISGLSTDVQQDLLIESEESKPDEDKMTRAEGGGLIEMLMETAAEGVSHSPGTEAHGHESTEISEEEAGVCQGDEDKPVAECVDMPEVMVSKPEDIMESCRNVETTEEKEASDGCGAKVDVDASAAAYVSVPDSQVSTEESERPEEISTTADGEDHGQLETRELEENLQNNSERDSSLVDADKITTECMNVPEVQTSMETSSPPEETPHPSPADVQSCASVEMLDKDLKEVGVLPKADESWSVPKGVNDPEPQINMEAATPPGEIPYPPAAGETQSREKVEVIDQSSEGNEATDNCVSESVVADVDMESDGTSAEPAQTEGETSELSTEFKTQLLTASCESKVDEGVFAADDVDVPAAATEEVSGQPSTQEGGEVCELGTDVHNNVVSGRFEPKSDEGSCPQSVVILEAPAETTATHEQISNVSSPVEEERQETVGESPHAFICDSNEPPTVASPEHKENMESGVENMDVEAGAVCGSTEGFDSAKGQVMQAHEEPVIISAQPDEEHKEGTVQREAMLLVFDSGEAGSPSEEQVQVIPQPEKEIQANQVVYEPISSPESSDDREVPAASQNHVGFSVLGMEEAVAQEVEGGSSAEGTAAVCTQVENNTEQQSQVPDSQEEEMSGRTSDVPDSCASPEAEQSVHVKQVAVISSSDDVRVPEGPPEGAAEASEDSTYPDDSTAAESSEAVQEGGEVAATAAAASTMFAIPDSTSEEYVILEPVPQSDISFDIVTQAAAESGLSVPFAAQVSPDMDLQGDAMNGPQVMVFSEAEVPQCQAPEAIEALNQKVIPPAGSLENSDHEQQPSAETMEVDTSEINITNSHTQKTGQDCAAVTVDANEENLGLQEVQILEDMEIGREVVLAEEDNEDDGDVSIIEKPQEKETVAPEKSEVKLVEKSKEDSTGSKFKPNITAEKVDGDKKEPEEVKPKKQQMNTQARTKARLAALAEQKAAAARKSANRHQLNLLALCQEIADDIETDSMLLKKIEEEKQAAEAAVAAAAAADAASKNETSEDAPHASTPANTDTAPAPAPAPAPTAPEASLTPAEELSTTQPPTADAAEAKPAEEPPKRRFFISQVSVPLKAHEKKKLTRYQRLRQVELQREKMSWARVKKLKSDQANQMFSDIDWQEPLKVFSQFSMSPVAKAPPPIASPASTPPPSGASTSKSEAPNKEAPKVDAPKDEPIKTEPIKTEPLKTEPIKTEPVKTDPVKPEMAKTEPTEAEEAKSQPVKPEASKSGPPVPEVRRSTRQTKAQASKESAAPGPAPKVTRSAAKKKLPAVPPPMPNGLNAQKQTPVEYKPYKPKPKYSFEDFELDDDPVPVAPARPSPQPTQMRPSIQPTPRAQLKPTLPGQPPSLAALKTRIGPAGQASGPSLPAAAAKPAPPAALSAKPQPKPPAVGSAASAPGQSRPAAPPPSKPDGGGESAQPTSTTAAAAVGATPEKTPSPAPAESGSKETTSSSAPTSRVSPEGSLELPDATKQSEEKPSANDVAPSENTPAEDQKTERKIQDGRTPISEACLQKELKKHREAEKDGTQTIIDAGQKHFGAVGCTVCGMLYSAANPEDESQHLLFHNQFISAVKYVGWKKERILAEYPDGKIILVLPDDPKYTLRKVEEIREVVDSDLGFQQVETKCPSKTKTFLFISSDKKVSGCLIAEHIEEGYRVIEDPVPEGSEGEKLMFERQRAWCCSTTPEPAICGISRVWVVSMMRRQGIASRMLDCLRNNFVYGSYLSKDEIAFSDPTPDGKLFATKYFGTSQFLVYNFVSGTSSSQPKAGTL